MTTPTPKSSTAPLLTLVAMLLGMSAYEVIKQAILPHMTLWQSHAITIVFSTAVATVVAGLAARRYGSLYQQVQDEVAQRRQAEQALQEAQQSLEKRVAERTGALAEANRTLQATATEHQQAAEALRRSEERLRAAVTGAPVVLFALDHKGVFTLSEGRGLASLGLAPGQVVGQSVFDLYRDAPEVGADVRRALAGENVTSIRHVAGMAFDSNYTPLFGPDGRVQGVIGVSTDVTERQKAEQEIVALNGQLERRVRRLAALRAIDSAISTSLDLRLTLGVFLEQARAQLGVDAAAVLLRNPKTHGLDYVLGQGLGVEDLSRLRRPLGLESVDEAVREQCRVHVPRLADRPEVLAHAPFLQKDRFQSYWAVPLIARGQVKGVLELFRREPPPSDPDWHDFLEILAGQAAIAVDNAVLFQGMQRSNQELARAYDETIEGWSRALDLRDKETDGHSRRVTEMSLALGHALGMSDDDLVQVRRGALLHDIGKMGISDSVLLKPGALTDEEWVIMRRHPVLAYEMLSPIPFLRPALDIPLCHHEKWDGNGYPRGLKGEEIPLPARIFAVVDVWDALRSDRPYRKGWPEDKARAHIQSLAGTHFDPKVVAAFLESVPARRAPDAGAWMGAAA